MLLWYVCKNLHDMCVMICFKGVFSVIGCLLGIKQWKVGGVEQFPGVFVLVLLLLLHITSSGSSISIPWGWKHQLHVDNPTCSWLNSEVLLLSWILPPGRVLIKHLGRKAPAGPWKVTFSSALCAQTCGTLSSAWKHWKRCRGCQYFRGVDARGC